MIVFDNIQAFNAIKADFAAEFTSKNIDVVPVQIQSGKYILNESLISNPDYSQFMKAFLQTVDYSTREVSPSEFINYLTNRP